MAVTATLDMGVYSPGDTATLTVVRDAGPTVLDVPILAADGTTVLADAQAQVVERFTVGDTLHEWTPVSDDGVTAVFTTVL